MERIGVIGLGRMGTAMARRFRDQGAKVCGWTRSGRAVDGVTVASDLPTLVSTSDVIVTSLFDDDAVAEVLDGLLRCDLAGKLIVETSTVTTAPLITRNDAIRAAGGRAVDAPISGGPEMVLGGTCGVFIGGNEGDAARAKATLELISNRVFHVGPLGSGLVMKVINNALLQAYVSGLRQLLPLAREAGLPLETVLNILNGGPAGLPFLKDRTPKILGEDDSVGFTVSAVLKDNAVFQAMADQYGVSVPFLEIADRELRAGAKQGHGEMDPAHLVGQAYRKD